MCVYVVVCVWVFMCVRVCVYMVVCVWVFMCVCTCMHVCESISIMSMSVSSYPILHVKFVKQALCLT